jgi:hypothetical protein
VTTEDYYEQQREGDEPDALQILGELKRKARSRTRSSVSKMATTARAKMSGITSISDRGTCVRSLRLSQ